MLNPNNQRHLSNLAVAIDFSRWRMQPFREHRLRALKQFVGSHYSQSGSDVRVPLNLLQLAHNIYLRQLVARAPRAMVSAKNPALAPVAADMQAWMDKATVGMRLNEALRQCVSNALFGLGVMKVGEAHAGDIEIYGMTQHVGQPFAEAVDFDDLVFDITAKRWDQIQFAGNRYRVPLDEAKNNPLYDPAERAKLTPQTRTAYNERGDPRVSTLQQSTMQLYDEYQEHVELWDIWLPKEKLVLVMPYQESTQGGFAGVKPLKVIQWQGPNQGPYVTLAYCDVPNNVMPAAPLQALQDLHESVNIGFRKLIRQMERQKSIMAVAGTAEGDADRIARSSDGDAIRVDFPERVKEMNWGGMKGENIVSAVQLKDLFVYMAGNLDALGGLSPQAQTLGQDELLNKNSAAQIAEMQDRTVNFTQEVYTRLGWQWWVNPHLTYETTRQVAGEDVPVSITPEMRQVPFTALDFEIDPYSMQHDTPQTRLALLLQLLQTVILPQMPLWAQQGISLDAKAQLDIISKYGNFPDLMRLVKIGPPPEQQGPMQMAQGMAQEPPSPPVTTRRQVRVNRPGTTRQGQSDVMAQLAMGGGQPSQAASVGRTG